MHKRRIVQTHQVIPSARRLIQSLRDLGYEFVQAVADLVDNSIVAGASGVAITVKFDGPDSWVTIADNGSGMTGSTLTEAMRYGAERTYEAADLGKFGLGLKTASMSQCRRLTVASRTDPSRQKIEIRVLDLDHVEKTNRWEVYTIEPSEAPRHLIAPLEDYPGTVVLWEELDRVLSYKVPWGEKARSGLLALTEQLEEHLSMVFHRFLSGEARRRKKLSITINGGPVEPWDPFARNEPRTEKLTAAEFEVHEPSGKGIVRYEPYVLPSRESFSSEEAWGRAGGPRRWNSQQGFYIYRADRMIQSGGWCWLRAADEHAKLARAALSFYPDLDSAFEINVAKISVKLPAHLRELLKEPTERLVRRAEAVYRKSSDRDSKGPWKTGHGRAHLADGHDSPLKRARLAIERAAKQANEEEALKRIVGVLRKESPEVARDFGW